MGFFESCRSMFGFWGSYMLLSKMVVTISISSSGTYGFFSLCIFINTNHFYISHFHRWVKTVLMVFICISLTTLDKHLFLCLVGVYVSCPEWYLHIFCCFQYLEHIKKGPLVGPYDQRFPSIHFHEGAGVWCLSNNAHGIWKCFLGYMARWFNAWAQ